MKSVRSLSELNTYRISIAVNERHYVFDGQSGARHDESTVHVRGAQLPGESGDPGVTTALRRANDGDTAGGDPVAAAVVASSVR